MTGVVALALLLLLLSAGLMILSAHLERRTQRVLARRVARVMRPGPPVRSAGEKLWTRVRERGRELLARPRWLFVAGMKRSWGTESGTVTLVLVGLVSGFIAWVLLAFALHLSPLIAGPGALAGFLLVPRGLLRREQRRTEARFMEGFPDAIDMLVRVIRAGLPVAAAIRTVGREAAAPVSTVFTRVADEIEIGVPFDEALSNMAAHMGLTDFSFFAMAVSLQRSTGGNLAVTLETFSEIIRKRRALRLKAHAATSEVRVSALILGSLPFLVIGAIAVIAPAYLTPLIYDPRGNIILGVALSGLLMAALTMRWLIRRGTAV